MQEVPDQAGFHFPFTPQEIDGIGLGGRIWLTLAGIAAAGAVFTISQATMGVGLVCLACFFGILARVFQAARNHKEIVRLLRR